MIRTSILLKYSRSLAEAAHESGLTEEIGRHFASFIALTVAVPELRSTLENPGIPVPVKTALCKEVASRAGFHPYFTEFLGLLVETHRLPCLDKIHDLFLQELDRLRGVIKARLITARPLTPAVRTAFGAGLHQALGQEVQLEALVDASLIGGVRLEARGRVYDGSIKHQLERFRQTLAGLA